MGSRRTAFISIQYKTFVAAAKTPYFIAHETTFEIAYFQFFTNANNLKVTKWLNIFENCSNKFFK